MVESERGGVSDPSPLPFGLLWSDPVARAHGRETIHMYAISTSVPFSTHTISKSIPSSENMLIGITQRTGFSWDRIGAAGEGNGTQDTRGMGCVPKPLCDAHQFPLPSASRSTFPEYRSGVA